MGVSEEWARRRLEEANTIYEPHDWSWAFQFRALLVWAAEMALVWWLACLMRGWTAG